MAIFDPKAVIVTLGGNTIADWADGSDVIDCSQQTDDGELVVGADGNGIFCLNPDQTGTLTIKLKQNSEDNKILSALRAAQRADIASYTPLSLSIKDLINKDQVTATGGYFVRQGNYTRGAGHNAQEWQIVFERMTITL